jgi:3-phosphoglycerate kinase
MDIIRPYKSNKNMTETERIEHLKQLNRARRNKAYRKKKMEQHKLKQQEEPKITIKKIDWCNNCIDEEDKEDKEEIEEEELLVYLLENVKFDNSKEDNENLELIDYLEDELGIEDKLINIDSDSDYDSN